MRGRKKETVKTEAVKVENAVKTEAAKVENAVKSAAEKAAPVVKAAAEKAAPAAKRAGRKTAKTAAKATATVKRAAAKKTETAITLQFSGKAYTTEELVKIAKDVWRYDLGGKVRDFKSVELFVKPEESVCYYVINGDVSGSFAI